MTQEQKNYKQTEKEICTTLRLFIEDRGYTSVREFFGLDNLLDVRGQKSEPDKAKAKISKSFSNMLNGQGGNLEIVYVTCALLEFDALELFPELKGLPKAKSTKSTSVFREEATSRQLDSLRSLEKLIGINIYCTSNWGVQLVLDRFAPYATKGNKTFRVNGERFTMEECETQEKKLLATSNALKFKIGACYIQIEKLKVQALDRDKERGKFLEAIEILKKENRRED